MGEADKKETKIEEEKMAQAPLDVEVAHLKEQSLQDGVKKEEPKKDKSFFVKEKTVTLKESEHQTLIKEVTEYKDKYVRLFAEFDNFRKRMEREKQEFAKYANGEVLSQFLSILDDLERSVEAAKTKHEDYDAFLKGIELVMVHVYEMLKKNQVKPIAAKGKMFDPHMHEVLMQEETDKFPEGMVVEEFQKGYMLDGRVIRTAKVKVATAKPQITQNETKQ